MDGKDARHLHSAGAPNVLAVSYWHDVNFGMKIKNYDLFKKYKYGKRSAATDWLKLFDINGLYPSTKDFFTAEKSALGDLQHVVDSFSTIVIGSNGVPVVKMVPGFFDKYSNSRLNSRTLTPNFLTHRFVKTQTMPQYYWNSKRSMFGSPNNRTTEYVAVNTEKPIRNHTAMKSRNPHEIEPDGKLCYKSTEVGAVLSHCVDFNSRAVRDIAVAAYGTLRDRCRKQHLKQMDRIEDLVNSCNDPNRNIWCLNNNASPPELRETTSHMTFDSLMHMYVKDAPAGSPLASLKEFHEF